MKVLLGVVFLVSALAAQQQFDHVFRTDGQWHCPVAMTAGEVIVPAVVGGTIAAVQDELERPVVAWQEGYTADRDGEWTIVVQGPPGGRCVLRLQRTRIARCDEGGGFRQDVAPGALQIILVPLQRGAYRFACDVTAGVLGIDLRDGQPTQEPRYRWMAHLNKNGRRRQWLEVMQPFTAEIALRNRHQGNACAVGELAAIVRPAPTGEVRHGRLPLGDGRLFEVQLERGELVRVAVASSDFDAQFDLWQPSGAVASFDDAGPLSLDAQHTFLVERSGLHRVLVYSPAGAGSGGFELRIDRAVLPKLQ